MMVWLGGFFAHLLYVHLLANRVHVTADTSFENQPRIAALDLNGNGASYKRISVTKLHRRGLTTSAKVAIALKNIIASSENVWTSSKYFRRYDKTGDLGTALDDFYSFKPNNVRNFRGMSDKVLVIYGTIGRKTLRLRVNGDRYSLGRPVLEVVDANTSSRPYIDRIIYGE